MSQSQKLPIIVHFHRRPFPGHFSIETLFGSLREEMRSEGCDVAVETMPHFSKGLVRRIANSRWAAKHQGDVNHITGDVNYIALALDPRRTVLTVHDCFALERLKGFKRWILKRYWFDLPIRRVAVVTVVSDETKRQLTRLVPDAAGKTVVIPNAISSCFKPTPQHFNAARPRILLLGTAPNKNLSRLFAAVAGLSCELRIIGRLSNEDRSRLDATRVPYSTAYDLTEQQIVEEYQRADIVSFASVYEGFGMPIIEAQWVERPVLTSNLSSMPEVAGAGACLVDPYDVASIRQGFEQIIRDADYRQEIVNAARLNRQRFSLNEVTRQYLELYRKMNDRCTKVNIF